MHLTKKSFTEKLWMIRRRRNCLSIKQVNRNTPQTSIFLSLNAALSQNSLNLASFRQRIRKKEASSRLFRKHQKQLVAPLAIASLILIIDSQLRAWLTWTLVRSQCSLRDWPDSRPRPKTVTTMWLSNSQCTTSNRMLPLLALNMIWNREKWQRGSKLPGLRSLNRSLQLAAAVMCSSNCLPSSKIRSRQNRSSNKYRRMSKRSLKPTAKLTLKTRKSNQRMTAGLR